MAPKVFDTDRVATYNADHDQWSGGQTQDDGLYHPERYRPVTQGENGADNGFYKASQQGSTRQHSPSSTPKIGAYQQNQHGQQYSPTISDRDPMVVTILPTRRASSSNKGLRIGSITGHINRAPRPTPNRSNQKKTHQDICRTVPRTMSQD